jgi:hypothetical protein
LEWHSIFIMNGPTHAFARVKSVALAGNLLFLSVPVALDHRRDRMVVLASTLCQAVDFVGPLSALLPVIHRVQWNDHL